MEATWLITLVGDVVKTYLEIIEMDPFKKERIGKTNLEVTRLGSGGTTFGNLHAAMSDNSAIDTIESAYDKGIRYFDTAPLYGNGLSEIRMGKAFKNLNRNEQKVAISTGFSSRQPGQA